MTNNGVDKVGNIVYDSGHETGRKRIGISATEIELLDDIPPSSETGIMSSGKNVSERTRVFDTQMPSTSVDRQKQSNPYQTLSLNRDQPKPNVSYQDGNNPQLNVAVDKLLDKYAPE